MKKSVKGVLVALAVIACAVLALKGSVLIVQSGSWSQTGNLSSARVGASAALLPDGRILVTGGDPGTGPVATADFFGTDGTISAAPPMVNARSQHVSVAMQDGRVLVAGGLTTGGSATNTAEIFDPVQNSWTAVGVAMMEARSGATAAVLQDGRVAIAGGQNGTVISSTIEIFNPAVGTFAVAGAMSSPRTQHAMALLQSGQVLIVGGNSGITGTPPAPTPVASTDIFDPVAGTVSAGPSLATARYNHSATTLLNGQVVVIGGNNGNANPAQMDVTPAELVDFTAATPAFTTLATNLATPREGHLAFLLPNNNNVLIVGGTSAGTTIASAELFTPLETPQDVWTYSFGPTGTMTTARSSAAGSANQVNAPSTTMQRNGVVMVAGGTDANGNALNTTEAYGYPTVQTDQSDYPPFTTVTITGSGFQPGETVTLSLVESPLIDTGSPFTTVADANGNFSDNSFVTDSHDVNVRFYLAALGSASQLLSQNTFTDSKPNKLTITTTASVTVAPGGTANYSLDLSFNGSNGSCSSPMTLAYTGSTPSGTTTTFNPTSISGSTTTDGTGSLALATSDSTAPGSYPFTITASQGTCTQSGSATADGTLVVVENTTTTLASSVNPTVFGESTTLTATVAETAGTTTPTGGTVTFKDGATTLGTATLTNGTATLAVSTLTVAGSPHSLTASYAGVANTFGASTSTAVSQVVHQASTSTALTSSANPSVFGQSVTFTASVTAVPPGAGTIPAGETVTFKDGTTTLGTGTTNASGVATFATSALTVTTHSITAVYAGDTNFATSTSNTVSQVVNQASTTTTLTSSANPSVFGQSVTFTATVTVNSPGAGTIPAGETVTFKDGGTAIGTGTTNASGVATFATSALAVATHTITAVYAGDTNFATSTSNTVLQVVNQGSTTTTLTSSTNPSVFGQSVTFTATVTVNSPGADTIPTGETVTFKDGTTTLGTGTTNASGVATFATSALTVATHTITAVYAGDTNFATSPSTAVSQVVNKASTTTTITNDLSAATVVGQAYSVAVSVTINAPGAGTIPNGDTVTVSDGSASCTVTLSSAAGSCSLTSTTAGNKTITATYNGDANFNTSTSAGVAHTVNKANTTTTITSNTPNPSTVGQSVTINYTVTVNSPGAGTPTGNVTVSDPAGDSCTGTVAAGTCSITTFPTAGTKTLTATYAGDTNFNTSASTGTSQTVNPKLAFTSTAFAIITGTCSSTISVQIQNANGSAATLTTATVLNLSSNSPNGKFFSDSGCTLPITSATIASGASTASFFYDDATIGSPVITVASTGLASVTQTEAITGLIFESNAFSVPIGVCSSAITLQSANSANGGPTALTLAATINLSSSSGGGKFYSNSTCTTLITTTTIGPGIDGGHDSNSFFYEDTVAGSPTLKGSAGTASATQTESVVTPPSISKAFSPTSIPVNGTSTITFTLTNPTVNTVALTNVAFSDTFSTTPGNLVAASTPAVANSCSGTVTATAGAGSVSLSGGTIPAGTGGSPGTCAVSVNVTAPTAGSYNNTTGAISSTNGGTGTTSNTATLTVLSPPSISKAFGTSTIALNGSTSLTFTITNPNTTQSLSGVGFSDPLPSGLVVSTPNGLNGGTCVTDGGSITANQGTSTISLSGATVPTNSSCSFSVNVTGTTSGTQNNTTNPVTSTNGGTGNTASASVTVVTPPTISKAFSPTSIPVNGTSTITFTLTNPAVNTVALTGVAFSDTFPTTPGNLVVASTPTVANSCSGTVTATAGAGSVSLSGGTIPAGTGGSPGTCTVSVNVTPPTLGTYSNTTGPISSANGGTGATSNAATLTVLSPPSITKAFGAATIPVNGTTSLTFTITNPNTLALNGLAFTDTFPSGLVVATSNGLSSTCGGTTTATAGAGSVILTGGTAAASSLCTINVNVTGTTSGVKNNTTGTVTSTNGGTGNTASASITVASPPTISKAFGATSIPLNASTSLSFTINNPNTTSLSGVAFSDSLPAGLVVATPNGLSSSCNGTTTAPAGSSSASLSGGTIAASGSCNISVNVTGTTTGLKNNTTGVVSANESGPGTTSNTASLTVNTRATSTTISPLTATAPIGGSAMFTITVTDTDSGPVSTPGGTVTVSSSNSSDTISACILAPSVAGSATCTATVAPAAPAGTHTINASYVATDSVHANSSTTTAAMLTVINAATTTTVTSSANPSVFGQGVYFTATVTPQQSGLGTPTGTVQFAIDSAPFGGAVTLSATGSATSATTSTLSVGPHTITATYTPAANSVYQTSNGSLTQTVTQDGTATLIMSLPNPSTFGQTVAITITVAASAPGSGTPSGTVSFLIDNVPAAVLTLMSGSATTSTSSLTVGSHTFTANYSGDGNFTASTASTTQMVSQATTSTALMVNPATINYGESTMVTATVADTSAGSTGTPTGTVTVSDGIVNPTTGDSCTITLSSGTGTCTLTPSATAPSGTTVTGTYSGDTNFQVSTGTTSLIVNAATTTTTLASPANNPSILGQAVMFTATVTDTSDSAVPNGTVNFYDGTMLIGSATLTGSATPNSGNATFTTALLSSSGGRHSITATFIGNADFSASTPSSAVSQAVSPRSTSTTVYLSPMQVVVGQPSTATVTVTDTPPTSPAGTPGAFALTIQSLNTARTGHAAALLPNGTVLIAGGEGASSNVLNSAEIYDPMAGTFTTLGTTLNAARTGATATLLNNGTVLVAGGSSDGTPTGALTSAEIYDPVAGTFTALSNSLTTPRTDATATLFYNGTAWIVLIAGGQNSTGPLNSTETYDPTQQKFTSSTGMLSVARYGHTATLLATGKILMAGGNSLSNAELYDPIALSSTPTGSMTTDRTNHAAALLPDGNVLIAGGTSSSNSGKAVNTTELYNTAAGTFTASGNMNAARSGLTATMLDSAQVLVVGGSNSTNPALATAELYTPSFDPLGTMMVSSSDNSDGITGSPCTLTLSGTGATTCASAVTDTPSEVGTSPHTITAAYTPASDGVHSPSSGTASLTVNKATPVFSNLTASQTITYGQNSVTLTGTLSANCGTGCSTVYPPSGETVSVTIGSASGSGTISDTSGAFSVTVTGTGALAVSGSPYTIYYSYGGDSNLNIAKDKSTTLTVQKATPVFSALTASQTITYGTPSISLAGTISAPCGMGCTVYPPNTETVSIMINGVTVTPAIGSNGYFSATFVTSTIPASATAYTITYSYNSGGTDTNFNSATNTNTSLTVNKATPVFSALTASQTIPYGTPSITVSGKLTAPTATPPNTDSVTVSISGTSVSRTVYLSSGSFTATLNTSAIPASMTAYTISYSFAGDSNFNTASDASTSLTVTPANTTTVAATAAAVYGQPNSITLSATVTASSPSTATVNQGTVTFAVTSGMTMIGSVTSSTAASGYASASFSVTGIPAGTYTITATYNPGVDFNTSRGMNLLTISQAPTTTTVTSSVPSSTYMEGVTFTATVAPPSGYNGTPTGSVSFYDATSGANCASPNGSAQIGATQTLQTTSGTTWASVTTASLTGGSHTVLACYSGDPNFSFSSGTVPQTVTPVPVVTVTPLNIAFMGQNVGTTSKAAAVTLSNVGDAQLNITKISIPPGGYSSEFGDTYNCGTSLGYPGESGSPATSCTIYVTFAPTDTGAANATLAIDDNDQNNGSAEQDVALTGSGLSTLTGGSFYPYAIFATANACGSLTMSGNSTIDSFNSALGYNSSQVLNGGNVGTNGNATLNGNATIYGTLADDYSTSSGNCNKSSITGLSMNGNAKVTGGQIALNGPINYPTPPAPNPAPPTTNQNISGSCPSAMTGCANGPGSKTVTLAPGSYGNVSASGGTTVLVSQGTYNLNSLTLSGNSMLKVTTGPVIVNLVGASMSGGSPAMDLSGGSIEDPLTPASLQFYYAGSHGINLSGGATSYATVYAPNAIVNMNGGPDFFGGIIGGSFTNSGNGALHYDTNLTNIPAGNGNYIWFSAVVNNVAGLPASQQAMLYFTNSTISFTATSTQCTGVGGTFNSGSGTCAISVPNGLVTFSSSLAHSLNASTSYSLTNTRWNTNVAPGEATGNTFITGVAMTVPTGGFPAGLQNVQWSAAISTDTPSITSLQWQWSAAVYTSFSTTYATASPVNSNVLGVNPEDGSADLNGSDPAGTPENYKQYLTGVGFFSVPGMIVPTAAQISAAPSSYNFALQSLSVPTKATMVSTLTNNDTVTHNISSTGIAMKGTNAADFVLQTGLQPGDTATIPNCVGLTSLAAGASCNLHVIFTATITGTEEAKIAISDDANNSPQTVYLSGTGQ